MTDSTSFKSSSCLKTFKLGRETDIEEIIDEKESEPIKSFTYAGKSIKKHTLRKTMGYLLMLY